MEAGSALADVIYGITNPSGVLAHTVYKASWEVASDFLSMSLREPPGRGHRYLTSAAAAEHVLFPFGYGGSYSTWAAEVVYVLPATISSAQLAAGANVTILVRVTNTGPVAGARVAHALLSRNAANPAEEWPNTWLPRAGFAKLHGIAPGAAEEAALVVGAWDLSRWDATRHAFTVRPGTFSVAVRDAAAGTQITVTP